jgi:hypothetical protein
MARKRKVRRRHRPTAARPPTSHAEGELLALARAVAEIDASGAGALDTALARLAEAYAPDAPLPRLLFTAWADRADDKTALLALAWAREQVRLALEELLARGAAARTARADVPPDVLAWVLLAACEAIALAPPDAAADRVRTLADFGRGAARPFD